MAAAEHLGRTRDANGRDVALLDPIGQWVRGADGPIERGALERVMAQLGDGRRRSRGMVWFTVAVVGVAAAIVAVTIGADVVKNGRSAVNDLMRSLVVTTPAVLGGLAGGVLVPIVAARQQRLRRARRVLLGHGVCAHCGYGIGGVPERDGVRVCPECACAWPAGEVGRVPEPARANATTRWGALALTIVGLVLLIACATLFLARL